jgi:Domain of unknown function (DUF4351)
MTKINHDQLFKELLTTFFIEFLELFFPAVLEYLDTDSIEFVDKEVFTDVVRGEKNILDLVALAKFQEQDYSFLIHVENQASSAPEFNRRMFRYFCSLFLKYEHPIYPIVIFSYDRPQRLDKNSFLNSNEEQIFQSQLNTMESEQQEQIMEITTSWERKGRLEEKLSITLRQLNRKLGTLPDAIAEQVKSLESSRLDALTEDLLDFQTIDDLRGWLNNS